MLRLIILDNLVIELLNSQLQIPHLIISLNLNYGYDNIPISTKYTCSTFNQHHQPMHSLIILSLIPVPIIDAPNSYDDYRPIIIILSCLIKTFEKVLVKQIKKTQQGFFDLSSISLGLQI